MKIERKSAVKKIKTLVLGPKIDADSFREKIEKTFHSDFMPNNVERTERLLGGIRCDVLLPELYASNRVLIYVHGGSFCGGSRDSWRSFCSTIANSTSSKVIVPEFRLAPSFPYPSPVEDVSSVLYSVFAEEKANSKESGLKPEVIVAADGSGASIALSVMFRLDTKHRRMVSKLILLSPWLDLATDSEIFTNKRVKDEILSSEDLRRASDLYTYASNLSSPSVSPLRAAPEDFDGFPEVYIQMGEKEILLEQAESFENLLLQSGINCILDVYPNMMHLFQMADEYLAESHEAVTKIGKCLNKREEMSVEEIKERNYLLKENNIKKVD